jgi:hypothetical protein
MAPHYTATPPPKGAKRLDKVTTYGSQTTVPAMQLVQQHNLLKRHKAI